jgi:hypothetical protein
VSFFLLRSQTQESDASPVTSCCPITHWFALRLRYLKNSFYYGILAILIYFVVFQNNWTHTSHWNMLFCGSQRTPSEVHALTRTICEIRLFTWLLKIFFFSFFLLIFCVPFCFVVILDCRTESDIK